MPLNPLHAAKLLGLMSSPAAGRVVHNGLEATAVLRFVLAPVLLRPSLKQLLLIQHNGSHSRRHLQDRFGGHSATFGRVRREGAL